MFCQKPPIDDNDPKKEFSIILPFLGPLSDKVQRRIKKLFRENITHGKLNVIFRTSNRLSQVLKYKDVVSPDLDSHIIYKFTCPSCNDGYIGETRKHYKVRYSQHLGISEYTDKPKTSGNPTTVRKHIIEKKCNCTSANFEIIGREADYHKRLIKESLFIKLHDFNINKQSTSTELFLF